MSSNNSEPSADRSMYCGGTNWNMDDMSGPHDSDINRRVKAWTLGHDSVMDFS